MPGSTAGSSGAGCGTIGQLLNAYDASCINYKAGTVQDLRQKIDAHLQINTTNPMSTNYTADDSAVLRNSAIFAGVLWTILALCFIYAIIVLL